MKSITVTDEMHQVSEEEGVQGFIKQLEELLADLKNGRKIHGAMVTAHLAIDDASLSPEMREQVGNTDNAVQHIVLATGPVNEIYRLVADTALSFGEGSVRRHKAECDDPDCDLTDDDARMIPFLKIIAAGLASTAAQNMEIGLALDELEKLVKTTRNAAAPLAQLKKMMENGEGQFVAIEGDKAVDLMKALVGSGVLPEDLEKSIQEKLAENGDAAPELPEGATYVSGNKVKH